jgi:hypothetical protein
MENTSNIANEIIAGAIERLDKANNPHMKQLQADLVHDLRNLLIQKDVEAEHGILLPFAPRLSGDAGFDGVVARHYEALQSR